MAYEISHVALSVNQGEDREDMQDVAFKAISNDGIHYLGIFDGHGDYGEFVASEAEQTVKEVVTDTYISDGNPLDYARIVRAKLRSLDRRLHGDERTHGSGTTATVACFKAGMIATAFLGDSEAIYFPDDNAPVKLITPHDTDNLAEVERVEKLGYRSKGLDYFGGALMVSRAIGDWKDGFVIAESEIVTYEITQPGTLVVASDGVWGRGRSDSHDDVEGLVRGLRNYSPGEIDELAFNLADIMPIRTRDNGSAVVARVEPRP